MKIKTLDSLSERLSKDLSWRKKELHEIKYFIDLGNIPDHRKTVLLRSAIAIIYAHWEGYLKVAGRCYLEFVAMQGLKNSQLADNFLVISLGANSQMLDGSKKHSAYESIVDFFYNKKEMPASIPFKTLLNTESNLSSTVLKEIIWCLGISYTPFESKEKIIDEKMLSKRNYIAHGEFLEISKSDVLELRDQIISMMNEFKNQIENSALTRTFLKNP